MQVRSKRIAPKAKMRGGELPQLAPAQSHTFPAPIRGWVLNENLATVGPAGAKILDNWLCTPTGIRVRGGSVKYATLDAPITALFAYESTVSKFFATTAAGIFDISAPASPTTILTASVTGQTSGDYSAVQFGTAGGDFLYITNGSNAPQLFDGATFTAITGVSTPAITGVTTTKLSQCWSFASRMFFVETGTMTAWYLPVDSIGGAAQPFSLAGIFAKGGSLLFGAKWSLDAGDGLDDKCVFVSTEGEVAVYEGTNPGSAADWRKAGVYQMPKPLGKNAYTSAGGDLLIATTVGLIPISASIQSDLSAIESKAASARIDVYWRARASESTDWNIVKSNRSGVMYISQPSSTGSTTLSVNLLTGGWSRITGWDTKCLGLYAANSYFGAGNNSVYLMDSSGSDDGAIYTAVYLGLHEALGAYGAFKTITQMRATFQATAEVMPQLSAQGDFNAELQSPPSSPSEYSDGGWDSGLWDDAEWDAVGSVSTSSIWQGIGVSGAFLAPELQLSFGITPTPNIELVSIDAQFRVGAVVA